MKKLLSIGLTSLIVCVLAYGQETLTIYPDNDAELLYTTRPGYTYYQNTNYGTSTLLRSYEWTSSGYPLRRKSLIGISLHQLPRFAYVVDAKLFLYSTGDHTTDITTGNSSYKSNASYLKRITSSWNESMVTWNTPPGTTSDFEVILSNSEASDQDYVVNVTNLVKDMQLNPSTSYGFMLELVNPLAYTNMQFASSDHADSDLYPRLEITYMIGSYEDQEGFEETITSWDNITGDGHDWTLETGSTPSLNTGPSGASEGSTYAFIEASGHASQNAYLQSEEFYLPETDNALIFFDYHMYGASMGSLSLEVSTNKGSTWTQIWTLSGDQGNSWHSGSVNLSDQVGGSVMLRFEGIVGTNYTSDICVDNIKIFANRDAVVTSTENYVYSRIPNSELGLAGPVQDQIHYFDGLGRIIQKIGVGVSPKGNDIIKPMEYDTYGRIAKDHLAFPADDDEYGTFRDYESTGDDVIGMQEDYYKIQFSLWPNDPYAFSKTIYELSSLNKVLAQGAPGETWQPSGTEQLEGHTKRSIISANSTSDAVRFWTVDGDACVSSSYYDSGELFKTTVYNENYHSTSNPWAYAIEYKNKLGLVVLKESFTSSETLRTYYLYDDRGLLVFVFPPEFSDLFDGSSGTISYASFSTDVESLAYYYAYNDRNLMVTKQLPGVEIIYMVYDKWDRLVLTQDGKTREDYGSTYYLYTSYDHMNRPVITGLCNNPGRSLAQTRSDIEGHSTRSLGWDNNASYGYDLSDGLPNGFTTVSEYTVTYYDNYDFCSDVDDFDGWIFDKSHEISNYIDQDQDDTNGHFDRATGLVTGTKTLVMDGTGLNWISSLIFYDNMYRPIQTKSTLFPMGSTIVSNDFDFKGRIERSKETQSFGSITKEVLTSNSYDHSGRLLKTTISIDQGTPVTLSENTYNELGEMVEKQLHQSSTQPTKQNVDYEYNMRGWLTSINDVDDLTSDGDHFAMRLFYDEEDTGIDNAALFNGNISGVSWVRSGSTDTEAYGYFYDEIDRLTSSDFKEKINGVWSNPTKYETSYSYDLNGNIVTLSRKNNLGTSQIDNLVNTYNGNQLDEVVDGGSVTLGAKDDGISGVDYSYDDNGNMTKDLNRNIEVDYNYLNLPKKVYEVGGVDDAISYIYDASGVKWLKMVNNNSLTNIAYCGSFVYKDAGATGTYALDYILNSEGRIDFDQSAYSFHYTLKDHLGNTRVEFDENNNITQTADYYPFGMTFTSGQGGDNKYLYNGKELQDELLGSVNLDWYAFDARMYDPQLGRWHALDPKAELAYNLTPYRYGFNNPINFVDTDGQFELPASQAKQYKRFSNYLQNGIQGISSNKTVMSALMKYGQFTEKQVINGLKWGSGPTINVTQLGGDNGGDIAGLYNPKKYGKNTLNLDVDLVVKLESATGDERDITLFEVAKTILHEYVHLGDNQDGEDYKGSVGNGEEGNAFEIEAYGRDIQDTNDAVEVMNEYNTRHGIDKRYSNSHLLPEITVLPKPKKEEEDD